MINVVVLFTCFNRKKETLNTIEKILNEKEKNINISIIVVDDCSTDGTYEALSKINDLVLLKTKGNYYYSKSMRFGMKYIKKTKLVFDYLLMINDDVDFYPGFLKKIINYQKKAKNCIVVGCTCDCNGVLSYGGIKYKKDSFEFYRVGPDNIEECDTFNGNCNLIPYDCFINCKIMDRHYRHSIGDFDYEFQCRKSGKYKIIVYNEYVGLCNRNSNNNTWFNENYSKLKRIKLLNSIKSGNPSIKNFYYLKKNFNLSLAFKSTVWPTKQF